MAIKLVWVKERDMDAKLTLMDDHQDGSRRVASWRMLPEAFEVLKDEDFDHVRKGINTCFHKILREITKDPEAVVSIRTHGKEPVKKRSYAERSRLRDKLKRDYPSVMLRCPCCGHVRPGTTDDKQWMHNVEAHCLRQHYEPDHPEMRVPWRNESLLPYNGRMYESKRDIAIDFLAKKCAERSRN